MNSTLNDSLIFAPQGNRSRVMKAMAQQLLQVMFNRFSYPLPHLTYMCILHILSQRFSILMTLNIHIQK